MQKHPQLTFIVRNPTGSIQLASQPYLKDIKLVKCHKCQKVHPVKNMMKFKCNQCGEVISGAKCDVGGCKGEIEFVYMGGFIVKECRKCKKVVPVS